MHSTVRRQARGTLVLWAAVLLLTVVASPGLRAQSDDSGEFEVQAAGHELVDGIYYVNARVSLRLPADAAAALHSRLPLTIRVEVEFLNRLRLWWDNVEHQVSQRIQLTYYSLTDRYVVHNINTGERPSFESLAEALEYVGRVDLLPIVDAAVLDEDRRYDVRVRAVLEPVELPGMLRFFAFWRREWSIESDWLQWRLDDD